MPRKKKQSKSARAKEYRRLVKKADKVMSAFIRNRDKAFYNGQCPLCQAKPIECCFHFISRHRYITRWNPTNMVGACHSCNYWERYFPDFSRAWLIKLHGADTYLSLVHQAATNLRFRPTAKELNTVIRTYGG